ncbi:MAG: hypothetical protein RLY78_1441 [Pseudomonadota bacterium]|jgi:predicted GNAT family N-acyltransferase
MSQLPDTPSSPSGPTPDAAPPSAVPSVPATPADVSPALRVRTGDWATLGPAASVVRQRVFVEEQGVPAELELDEADALCVHALAEDDGGVIGTGRLLPAEAGVAKVGRMAVLPRGRGRGIGAALLRALTEAAVARGDRELRLHAQLSARGFYERAGYAVEGEVFVEAGIEHIEMARRLG